MPTATWRQIRLAQDKCEAWYLHLLNPEHQELLAYKQKREACRDMWYGLHRGERAMWMACAILGKAAITVPSIDDSIPVYDLPHGITTEDIQEGKRIRGILLTYHGQWGYELPDIVRALDRGIEGDELTDILAGHPYYKELADQIFTHTLSVGRKNGFSQNSISIEHCTK